MIAPVSHQYMVFYMGQSVEIEFGTGKMAQQVKVSATKPEFDP